MTEETKPTPRTDAATGGTVHVTAFDLLNCSRELERENAELTAENEVLREQNFAMNKTLAEIRAGDTK